MSEEMANKIHPDNEAVVLVQDSTARLGPSRQTTALARKAISYQKRQWFTNICCIALCPFLMVALSSILGNLITELINQSQSPEDYVYCSNVPNMNSLNIPYWNTSFTGYPETEINEITKLQYPDATQPKILHANWARVTFSDNRGPPGAERASFQRPCVFWHEAEYPNSAPYELSPGVNSTGRFYRDATHLAQPIGGWARVIQTADRSLIESQTVNIFSQYQERTWMLVDYADGVDPAALGTKDPQSPLTLLELAALPETPAFTSPQTAATGLFGTIPTRFYFNISSVAGDVVAANTATRVPWYNITRVGSLGLDDLISSELGVAIDEIALLDKTDIRSGNISERNAILLVVNDKLATLPHGALYFTKIDHPNLAYQWDAIIGTDIRVSSSSNFPSQGRRQLLQQTQLDNAILRNGNVAGLGNAQITHGFRILPSVQDTLIVVPFEGIIGSILFPFGISFLLPIFALVLVNEKEQRILVMMKMNGMRPLPYYISHYVTFFILYAVSGLIFTIGGTGFNLSLFTLTETGLIYFLMFLWGNCMISLAFFFAAFFNRSRFALVSIFLIVLCSVIISLVVDELFYDSPAPTTYFIWPPFAFYRALSLLNRHAFTETLIPYKFNMLTPGDEVLEIVIAMIISIPVYLFIAYYLEQVLPSEFGVRKPWHFVVTDTMNYFKNGKESSKKQENDMAVAIQIDESETKFEDADVKEERDRVINSEISSDEYPLIMKNMRKVYAGRGGAGPKLAVKDVSFAVEKNITFGLLGPNGAGKTTLISILTGLYESSSGSALIAGNNVQNNSEEVYKVIGICPQFDIQWEDLTVGEHLYFYARLKGVVPSDEKQAVSRALKDVSLTDFENRLSKGLSGGERRRLSIAIALLGDPKVIFLDEPTTGLDPEVRRLIWDIVNDARDGRTIVLTTHSMEEAEALCQRIGIMAKGTLRCYANPTRLKELYGSGFKIYANCASGKTDDVANFLEGVLPAGFSRVDAFDTSISYEFPAGKGVLAKLFEAIEKDKANVGILDYGIGETTLDEVFLRLISEQDAGAEY